MITRLTEWEGEEHRLVELGGLTHGQGFPGPFQRKPGRQIRRIFVHQTLSPPGLGATAVGGLVRWQVAKGQPSQPHHVVVPAYLDVLEGKYEVFRVWRDDWITQHTHPAYDQDAISVCVTGSYRSRHAVDDLQAPDSATLEAVEFVLEDYLLPRYGLSWHDVLGGFDAGHLASPGDDLELMIRRRRGEPFSLPPDEPSDDRPLRTAAQRAAALAQLGLDGSSQAQLQLSIEKIQRDTDFLQVTGVWDALTERAIRQALLAS